VPQDDARAADWYRKAANQGNAQGKALLGRLYQFGWGVPQDEIQAHMWFNLAAAQGEMKRPTPKRGWPFIIKEGPWRGRPFL